MERIVASLSLFLSAFWLSVAVAPSAAAFPEVSYESHRTWFVKLTGGPALQFLKGDLRLQDGGGSKVELRDDLNLDDARTLWAQLDFQPIRGHHLVLGYTPLRFDGHNTLPSDLLVNGNLYLAGDDVEAKLELRSYDITYRFDLFMGEKVNVSPVFSVNLLDAEGGLENRTAGLSDRDDIFLPLPAVGLRFEAFPFSRLALFGEAKGFTLGGNATTLNAEGGFTVHIINNIAFYASYRYALYDIDRGDIELNTALHGPYVGLSFRY
jgi:hypothetical protein